MLAGREKFAAAAPLSVILGSFGGGGISAIDIKNGNQQPLEPADIRICDEYENR